MRYIGAMNSHWYHALGCTLLRSEKRCQLFCEKEPSSRPTWRLLLAVKQWRYCSTGLGHKVARGRSEVTILVERRRQFSAGNSIGEAFRGAGAGGRVCSNKWFTTPAHRGQSLCPLSSAGHTLTRAGWACRSMQELIHTVSKSCTCTVVASHWLIALLWRSLAELPKWRGLYTRSFDSHCTHRAKHVPTAWT